jgi:serine/threonine-protein kinase
VPVDGGVPQPLTKPDHGALSHQAPQILPGGQFVVFTATPGVGAFDRASIELLSLATGRTTTLVQGGYFGRYVASGPSAGHLLYLREGTLYAAAFDPTDARLRGPGIPVLNDVAGQPFWGSGQFDVSQSGTLYYQRGAAVANDPYPVLWLDRAGKTTPLLANPGTYQTPRFSPDGARLALTLVSEGRSDVFVYDWQRDRLSRLDTAGRVTGDPIWAPDGKHLVVRSQSSLTASDGSALLWMPADGGESTPLVSSRRFVYPSSFSPDGKRLAYGELSAETRGDIWVLPLDITDPTRPKPGQLEAFLRTSSDEGGAAFSPDGRWIAYGSDESGRFELYVRPAGGDSAGAGGKWLVSKDPFSQAPAWSRDGRQISFLAPSATPSPAAQLNFRLMTVDIAVRDGALVAETPRMWADVPIRLTTGSSITSAASAFALHPDGQRVAVFPGKAAGAEPGQSGPVHVTVLLNFSDELRRRVPAGKP